MDSDKARKLFHEGAMLILLDVPPRTEFGIDLNSWVVGEKFKGVKMIPPGLHFVFLSARSKEGDTGVRTGFLYNFTHSETVVRRWDRCQEDFSELPISEEELERFRTSREELDRFCAPYPHEGYDKWISLTNYMTAELAKQLQPINGRISSATMLSSPGSTTASRRRDAAEAAAAAAAAAAGSSAARAQGTGGLPDMAPLPGTAMRFTPIPGRRVPAGAALPDVTRFGMDASYVLTQLLQACSGRWPDVLGEIQMAFVCFLVGMQYDAFEQWKRLVHVLCSCQEAVAGAEELYDGFIRVLHYQVREVPEDFFVDIVSSHNFLTSSLGSFFRNLEDSGASQALKSRGSAFQKHLTGKFKWDFLGDLPEDAPVVVELEGAG